MNNPGLSGVSHPSVRPSDSHLKAFHANPSFHSTCAGLRLLRTAPWWAESAASSDRSPAASVGAAAHRNPEPAVEPPQAAGRGVADRLVTLLFE
ncbi:MAG: hypothetical protein D6725_10635 [Planctomycetota bacterium]|nr:MAG: hypothetical protein D6725_10635 [Planctomycetota bacterium]